MRDDTHTQPDRLSLGGAAGIIRWLLQTLLVKCRLRQNKDRRDNEG